uniref:Triple gene block protein 1 n=1 Tax=Okra mild mottle virus TaxID=3161050 RepID=A0AAU7LN13_9VIRU
MNELLTLLSKYNFTRLGHKLGDPIIINCVPGAGKSTLIRELLNTNDCFAAYSTVKADPPNLTGRRIEKLPSDLPSGKLIILDEYQNLNTIPSGIFAAFGDPLQTSHPLNLEATFIATKTHRFGKSTCNLLKALNFTVHSDKDDVVVIENLFEGVLEGTVICFEQEVVQLLRRHSVKFLQPCEFQGDTFEIVTFVTSGIVEDENRSKHLVCLTRHSTKLKVLCPNATYPRQS